MNKVLVVPVAALMLSGCFGIHLGGRTPKDYQGEMLTMRPRDEVAQCIAQVVRAGPPVDNGKALVVTSSIPRTGNRYTISSDDEQTRVLIQGPASDEPQLVASCLPLRQAPQVS